MKYWVQKSVTVTFPDGTEAIHDRVGGSCHGIRVYNGVLNLEFQNGELADVEHVMSYPLVAIRSYCIERV